MIKVGDDYFVWYSRSVGPHKGFHTGDEEAKVFPWDYCDIWYAVSKDGYRWEEKGPAVVRGERGAYDDRSVFTPEILEYEGKYYLVYQVVQHPYVNRSFESIAIAVADSPHGPFTKSKEPILTPTKDGIWEGEEDNRFAVKKKGSFDSHKVHDPILFAFRGKFYLYYKGEPMGEELYMGGRETKWGVAIADNILGPYHRSEYNPVTNSGHETCLWQYNGGIAAFLRTDGVEKNTIQFAEDGINFEIKSVIKQGPEACGPYRHLESDSKIHTFGSVIYEKCSDTFYEEPPYSKIEVVDRIGSGDAYISGVLYGILSENGSCAKALSFGNAAGAIKNTIPGDMQASLRGEVEAVIQSHRLKGNDCEMVR